MGITVGVTVEINSRFILPRSLFPVPRTEMVGESIRYVKGGSNVILRCIVRDALEPPLYISWFYNGHQIYNENSQGWKMAFERSILTGVDVPSQAMSPSNLPLVSSAAAAAATSPSFYQRASSVRFKSVSSEGMGNGNAQFTSLGEMVSSSSWPPLIITGAAIKLIERSAV